jgi:hypothetical protein
MNKIIALMGMKSNLNNILVEKAYNLMGRMAQCCPDVDIIIDRKPFEGCNLPHMERQKAMCDMRNNMIKKYVDFDYHTHVLTIDADLVDYPPSIPYLLAKYKNAVVGCANFLEGHGFRFYDVAGYIEKYNGEFFPASLTPPYFKNVFNDTIELESVGLCYIVPAEVFKNYKYEPPTIWATEHFSICQGAKKMGYKVLCDMHTAVTHAYLPNYGENCH